MSEQEAQNFFKKVSNYNLSQFIDLAQGFVKKKVLVEGFGRFYPVNGKEVTVNYVGELDDGRNVDNTFISKEPHQFVMGGNSVVYGLELGIKSMKIGEKALISVDPEYGHLPLENFKKNISDKKFMETSLEVKFDLKSLEVSEAKLYSRIIYEVDLLLIDNPRKVKSQLSTEEKISYANELKEEGIKAFKEKYYQEGSVYFNAGLDYLTQIPSIEMNKVQDLKHSLILNICNCLIHMNQYGYALKKVEQAIQIKVNAKCYYYRALSRMYLAEFDAAENDITKLEDFMPGDPLVKDLKSKLLQTKDDYQMQSGKIVKNHLSSLYNDKLLIAGSQLPKFNPENKILYLDIIVNENSKNPSKLKFEIYKETWAEELIKALSKGVGIQSLVVENEFLICGGESGKLPLDYIDFKDTISSFEQMQSFLEKEQTSQKPNKLALQYLALYPCFETGLVVLEIPEVKEDQVVLKISRKLINQSIQKDLLVLGKCFFNSELIPNFSSEDQIKVTSRGISFNLK